MWEFVFKSVVSSLVAVAFASVSSFEPKLLALHVKECSGMSPKHVCFYNQTDKGAKEDLNMTRL